MRNVYEIRVSVGLIMFYIVFRQGSCTFVIRNPIRVSRELWYPSNVSLLYRLSNKDNVVPRINFHFLQYVKACMTLEEFLEIPEDPRIRESVFEVKGRSAFLKTFLLICEENPICCI